MRPFNTALLVFIVVSVAAAQSADSLLLDTRLTVHTLVREDIFAGFRNNNLDRLSKAEQNIEIMFKERPDQRANLLAWKAGATMYRAVRAHESGQAEEFGRRYAEALDGFAAAAKLETGNDGVAAITGGTMAVFADRLPDKQRAGAWSIAYDNYSLLWKQHASPIAWRPSSSELAHERPQTGLSLRQANLGRGRLPLIARIAWPIPVHLVLLPRAPED